MITGTPTVGAKARRVSVRAWQSSWASVAVPRTHRFGCWVSRPPQPLVAASASINDRLCAWQLRRKFQESGQCFAQIRWPSVTSTRAERRPSAEPAFGRRGDDPGIWGCGIRVYSSRPVAFPSGRQRGTLGGTECASMER